MFRRSSIFLQEVPIYSDLVRFLGAVILGFVLVFPSFAQEGGAKTEPFLSWDKTAEQAQTLLERDSVSTDELEAIRSKLAEQRDKAFDRREAGSVEARALEAELNSLGPPPEEGSTEPESIAQERTRLQEAIADANKPVRDAQQSFRRAELLISELDSKIREQSTVELLKRAPSPLLPQRWLTAYSEIRKVAGTAISLLDDTNENRSFFERAGDRMPRFLLLFVLAIVILVVGQRFVTRSLDRAVSRSVNRRRRKVIAILDNLSRLVIPLLAAFVLLLALPLNELPADREVAILPVAIVIVLFLTLGHWLGHTLFSPTAPDLRILDLDDRQSWSGLRMCQVLGVILSLQALLEISEKSFHLTNMTSAVLSFPVVLAGSVTLWSLAALIKIAGTVPTTKAGHDASSEHFGLLVLLARFMQVCAGLSVVFVVVGFVNLARFAMTPLILSLAEISMGLVVFYLIMGVIEEFVGPASDEEREELSLIPVAVIFLIVLALAPILALTWHARPADIGEVWRLLTVGVEFGDVRISLDVVITLLVALVIGILLTRWVQRMLRVTILPRARVDRGAQNALVTVVGYVGLTLSALVAISMAGLNLASLAFIAGALSLGIGFGLQTIVSNFVSGIILLAERPIKEGDWIEVAGYTGLVRKISVRSTRIETFDRHDVIVPNSEIIAGTVKNMTHSSQTGRLVVPVGVAYGSDIEATRNILLKAVGENEYILPNPEPQVLFMGLGDSSLDFEVRCFLREIFTIPHAQSDLLFAIYRSLGEAGIEIPFPQRDIHLRDIDKLVDAIKGTREETAGQAPVVSDDTKKR